jgi:hypothetical protein
MSRTEQAIGKHGQELAQATLRRMGVKMVEQIGTPVHLIPHLRDKGYYRVIFGEKVSGDHRGITFGGISVLVETKTILGRETLRWSDFREHQPGRLSEHHDEGGLSLVAWVSDIGVFVLRWPIPGFGPGKSINFERARELEITEI